MAKVRTKNNRTKNATKVRTKDETQFVYLKLRRDEYELLRAKIHEVAVETTRVLKRIAKHREQKERLKTETRKRLASLRAA